MICRPIYGITWEDNIRLRVHPYTFTSGPAIKDVNIEWEWGVCQKWINVDIGEREFKLQWTSTRSIIIPRSHAAPLLDRLHWLPVHKHITYKLCVLMYDVYHRMAPGYLANLCSRCDDHRLRSSAHGDFITRWTRTRLADSSFTTAGPAAWNALLASVQNTDSRAAFCCRLKTS